jgi:hypothetical protein
MTGYVENTAHIGGSLVVKLSIISVLASLFFVSFVRLCILDMQRSKVLYELDVTILKLIKPSLSKKDSTARVGGTSTSTYTHRFSRLSQEKCIVENWRWNWLTPRRTIDSCRFLLPFQPTLQFRT